MVFAHFFGSIINFQLLDCFYFEAHHLEGHCLTIKLDVGHNHRTEITIGTLSSHFI